jgi:hypothetical protein
MTRPVSDSNVGCGEPANRIKMVTLHRLDCYRSSTLGKSFIRDAGFSQAVKEKKEQKPRADLIPAYLGNWIRKI